MDQIVAVTGATGRQGGAVARHLLAAGWKVRALTRKPQGEPARKLAALGAEVVQVDMRDKDSLLPAFRGAHGVYSVQNPMLSSIEDEIRQGTTVADAAAESRVAHVVYGSAGIGRAGTGVGSWDSKLAVEAHMRQLGLPVTVLRPMAFMELMTDKGYYPAVSTWHLMPKLTGADMPVAWLAVDDLGAIAAKVFAEPAGFIGADLSLCADIKSNVECREIWRSVKGRPPRGFPMPVWLFKKFVGDDLLTMWRWLSTAGLEFDTALTRELRPNALTVRDFLS